MHITACFKESAKMAHPISTPRAAMKANTILETIGRTPEVRIQRLFGPDAQV